MKTSSLVLAGSLVVNVALAVFLVVRSPDSSVPAANADGTASAGAAVSSAPGAPGSAAAKKTAAKSAASDTARPLWDRLRSDDLPTLVARLREAGFPPIVIRRIVTTLITEKFDARRLELEKGYLEAPFWTNATGPYNDPKIGPELRQLQRQQMQLAQQALGENLADMFADTDENRALLRFQIGNIPPEKIQQLYDVVNDYGEKRSAIYAALRSGPLLDADREKLVALEHAQRDALAKFLSPAELDDFMLRSSDSSARLRNLIAPMRPSEQEFRTIYPLYQAFSEQFPQDGNLSPEQNAARAAGLAQLVGQVKTLLPPDRAADIDQVANTSASQLNRLVARLDLPLSAATEVSNVQKDTQQRATAIRSDSSLNAAAKRTQLSALADEATAKVSTALGGSRGLEAYKEYGGQWLTNLVPRPPTPPQPPKG
ncbi:MAG TPA: hypothetical protein VHD62_16345 [Opitutaceae bacterium]|nr:hypothetical protein [Opitutaceae bacterium]